MNYRRLFGKVLRPGEIITAWETLITLDYCNQYHEETLTDVLLQLPQLHQELHLEYNDSSHVGSLVVNVYDYHGYQLQHILINLNIQDTH